MKIFIFIILILSLGLSCVPKSKIKRKDNQNCEGIIHGQSLSRTRYKSPSVQEGSYCISENQTAICNNGIIGNYSGSYIYSSCSNENASGSDSYVLQDSNELDGNYSRPELILIQNKLYLSSALTSGRDRQFKLFDVSSNLLFTPLGDLVHPLNESPTDIRLATDGSHLWYGIETVSSFSEMKCGFNHLSMARYNLSQDDQASSLVDYQFNFSSGCPSGPQFMMALTKGEITLPEKVKHVDDPSPIYLNNHYYLMARGGVGPVEYIFKFDKNLNFVEEIVLDLSSKLEGGSISQNAFVEINGKVYIIAGVQFGGPRDGTSSIKAIPLSNDLKSVQGSIIELISEQNTYYTRVTAAKFHQGKLYFNYLNKSTNSTDNDQGYIGIVNVLENGQFAFLESILIQEQNAPADQHSSFELVNDKIFVSIQTPDAKVMVKVYGTNSQPPTQTPTPNPTLPACGEPCSSLTVGSNEFISCMETNCGPKPPQEEEPVCGEPCSRLTVGSSEFISCMETNCGPKPPQGQ